jgi:hypothetical protein
MLDSCGHETSRWSLLYDNDHDFATTYQLLGGDTLVADFFSRMDCYAIWVTSVFLQASVWIWSGKPIIIRWQDTWAWRRPWKYFKSIFIGWSSDRMSTSILNYAPPMPSPNQPFIRKGCTHPCWLLIGPRSPYWWITCPPYPQTSMAMTVFLWLLIDSQRWPFWKPKRRL